MLGLFTELRGSLIRRSSANRVSRKFVPALCITTILCLAECLCRVAGLQFCDSCYDEDIVPTTYL